MKLEGLELLKLLDRVPILVEAFELIGRMYDILREFCSTGVAVALARGGLVVLFLN